MDSYIKEKIEDFRIYRKKNNKTHKPRITLIGFFRVRYFLINLYNGWEKSHNFINSVFKPPMIILKRPFYKKLMLYPQISIFADGDIGFSWKNETYEILLLISQKFWVKGGFYAEDINSKKQCFSGNLKLIIKELLKWL